MSLQKRCLAQVHPQDRERGVRYFHQRRVSLDTPQSGGVTATVTGSSGATYQVHLDWSRVAAINLLRLSCSCPRFADSIVCKHVWASMIAFDRSEFAESVPGKGPLDLILDPPHTDDDQQPASRSKSDTLVELAAAPPEGFLVDGASGQAIRSLAEYDALYGESFDPARVLDHLQPYRRAPEPIWRRQLGSIRAASGDARQQPTQRWPNYRQVSYRLNIGRCFEHDQLVVDLYQRKTKKNGELGRLTKLNLDREVQTPFSDPVDRDLVQLFSSSRNPDADPYSYYSSFSRTSGTVPALFYDTVLPQLCGTERFGWMASGSGDPKAANLLTWDDGPAWRFRIELLHDEEVGSIRIRGWLHRGEEERPLAEPVLLLANGVVVWQREIARLEAKEVFPWISLLRREKEIEVPRAELDALLEELASLPGLPPLTLPEAWQWSEAAPEPQPGLVLRPAAAPGSKRLEGDVIFDYDGFQILARRPGTSAFDADRRRMIQRDAAAESTAFELLREVGMKRPAAYRRDHCDVQLSPNNLQEALEPLLTAGWTLEAEGRRVRSAGAVSLRVASHIDWFELRGDVEFDTTSIALPRLLAAVRRGDTMVRLDDGSQGFLPKAWRERFDPLAKLAYGDTGDAVRYLPSQATLLDALLAAEPRADFDQRFAQTREQLTSFDHIEPAKEPRGFHGELRGYQRDGLGWLRFLQTMRLGGCLADDMGLGKTVQVLALLQARRLGSKPAGERRPSLIVAPRSLVHNWLEEGARFTPRLRLAAYSGPQRQKLLERLDELDVVVTTYGLVRRDIQRLESLELDYAILDEAQAIKNAGSQAAKAARLLRAEHRLALTGTPVENHLGELWSIFEFLNPGMLGRLPAFKKLTRGFKPEGSAVDALTRALKPFILRRTKQEVLSDLPEKTEQTLYCELEPKQWKLYKELRDHYRASLGRRIESSGLGRSKIHVLEALLRLRQAACHPGLLDPTRNGQSSAKLETLLEQLDEITGSGHKALVFSQFVRLLEIVKHHLDERGTTYEYLDGKTRQRQKRIDRFQTDPDCQLFLISLKAGGLGLNLTAADYVFILDPWWNPAVEAQAVDRAHRIGQTRPVFAYRLIARDTVEEKILELQKSKRELADAILSASGSMIRDLSAEDLQLLLS
ncbi:MAG: DEAD/DEAH box helicase [Acidobacteriota bacterium]